MNKFYTFLILGALAVSANASGLKGQPMTKTIDKPRFADVATLTLPMEKNDARKAPAAKAASYSDIQGEGAWICSTLLSFAPKVSMALTIINEETGEALIEGLNTMFDLKANVDLEAGVLSIPTPQYLGVDDFGDEIYFYLKDVVNGNVMAGMSSQEATVGMIDGNKIVFPTMDVWCLADPDNEEATWWAVTYENEFEIYNADEDINDGWTNVGEADFMDGWLLPGLDIDQELNVYKVLLQRSNEDPDEYRLVDPYKGESPAAEFNEFEYHGYIQFNIADPDHVIFRIVNAGFASESYGIERFYCYNLLGMYHVYFNSMGYEVSPSDIVNVLDQEGVSVPYSRFRNNEVTLSYIMAEDEYGMEHKLYDAAFGDQGDRLGGFIWTDPTTQEAFNMECRITFPEGAFEGVESVDAGMDASVEYYNMQGMRVAAPEAGQILLRRQGSSVSKIVKK